MATAARPQTNVTTAAPASAMVLYNKKELAAFTNADAKALLQPMLPAGVSYEVVLSELYFAIQKNPEIAKCEVPSMLMAVQRCLSWGLTIGETAHLVPFKGKLTAVRDYKGDVELVVRAGGARSIDAYVVWDDEQFDYGLGDSPFVKHRPALRRKDGAKIVAAYAVAHIGQGTPAKIVIMGVDEIDAIRQAKSKSWKEEWHPTIKGKKVPIPIERIPWYCEKTVIHKIVKQLPTTAALQAVVRELEDEEIIIDAEIEDAPASGDSVRETSQGSTAGVGPAGAGSHAAGEPRADADGVVEEPGDGPRNGPPCPKCGATMRDDRLTKTSVRAPDYKCVAIVGNENAQGPCEGLYWAGQWPPKPLATDEQRAELGRLAKVAEKVGLPKVTIAAVNKKVADPELKEHRAAEHIKALNEKIAEKEKENARDARAKEVGASGTADSSPATKELF